MTSSSGSSSAGGAGAGAGGEGGEGAEREKGSFLDQAIFNIRRKTSLGKQLLFQSPSLFSFPFLPIPPP